MGQSISSGSRSMKGTSFQRSLVKWRSPPPRPFFHFITSSSLSCSNTCSQNWYSSKGNELAWPKRGTKWIPQNESSQSARASALQRFSAVSRARGRRPSRDGSERSRLSVELPVISGNSFAPQSSVRSGSSEQTESSENFRVQVGRRSSVGRIGIDSMLTGPKSEARLRVEGLLGDIGCRVSCMDTSTLIAWAASCCWSFESFVLNRCISTST
mmetsp:Transcript_10474/g.25209  ORF Transcript_10474/g.25209 Transcript_10474/m.25209 type:complete len:213 (-) Transcript_10474:419-1057(-)